LLEEGFERRILQWRHYKEDPKRIVDEVGFFDHLFLFVYMFTVKDVFWCRVLQLKVCRRRILNELFETSLKEFQK
jgi:hypothetical protein